ncbi:MAG TPA: hypothetical protein VFY29_00905 [Terriglobia bacterium]|nr:hypothetical protein [Terriglobia bacterium]
MTSTDTSFPRRALLAVLLVGFLGSGAELILLEHYQDLPQLIPLALILLGLGTVIWNLLSPGRPALRWLRIVMVLCAVSGLAGVALHYRGNMEFQLEADPSAGGMELFMKIMRAKAPPALAPGAMLQLGLVGLVFTWKHPALASPEKPEI